MPFVKDTSYRSLPFSPETPSDGSPCFLTVKELVEKISKTGPGHVYRCRTVGIVTSNYGQHVLHEINDEMSMVPLCLDHYTRPLPHVGRPYLAQVFGFVENRGEAGIVISPHLLQSIPAYIAIRIREIMKWVVATHFALHDEAKKGE